MSKENILCACGNDAKYLHNNGYRRKDGTYKTYGRCQECHNASMRKYMSKRYSTAEGRQAIIDASKRYYDKRKQERNG